jgi:hypothetical protein
MDREKKIVEPKISPDIEKTKDSARTVALELFLTLAEQASLPPGIDSRTGLVCQSMRDYLDSI